MGFPMSAGRYNEDLLCKIPEVSEMRSLRVERGCIPCRFFPSHQMLEVQLAAASACDQLRGHRICIWIEAALLMRCKMC